jgi:hypothetical protein
VTQVALLLSGHSKPHKRTEMLYPAAGVHHTPKGSQTAVDNG